MGLVIECKGLRQKRLYQGFCLECEGEREKMNLVWRKGICLEHVELRYVWNIQIDMFEAWRICI